MSEEITRWGLGEKFTDALQEAFASEEVLGAAMKPLRDAADQVWDSLSADIADRMAGEISDEVRRRADAIVEALLRGDEALLRSFMAAYGHRNPDIAWDGTFRPGFWVKVRREIAEANERLLREQLVLDLTAERDALGAELVGARGQIRKLQQEIEEVRE